MVCSKCKKTVEKFDKDWTVGNSLIGENVYIIFKICPLCNDRNSITQFTFEEACNCIGYYVEKNEFPKKITYEESDAIECMKKFVDEE